MATQPIVPEGTEKIEVRRRAFDLAKLERISLKSILERKKIATIEEAMRRVGNDKAVLLQMIDAGLRDQEVKAFRTTIRVDPEKHPEVVYSAKTCLQFAANFFVLAEISKDEKGVERTRKEKMKAAFGFVKANPKLYETMIGLANAASGEVEEEEEEEEEKES